MDAKLQALVQALLQNDQSGEAPQPVAAFSRMPQGTQYLLPDGRRPAMRSESTEYERARRDMPPAPSILSSLINPQYSEFMDAIRRRDADIMNSTGYNPQNPPGK